MSLFCDLIFFSKMGNNDDDVHCTKIMAKAYYRFLIYSNLFYCVLYSIIFLFLFLRYLANLTLESLQEMFTGAKDIMDWLGNCASLVASQVDLT